MFNTISELNLKLNNVALNRYAALLLSLRNL